MMDNVLFLITHKGSGHQDFAKVLDQNSRIQLFESDYIYNHVEGLNALISMKHKNDTTAAVYLTTLVDNHALSNKSICGFCKFIYLIRPPHYTLSKLMSEGMTERSATRYYTFRVRRMAQLAKMTPGAIFLTWENLVRGHGFQEIEQYINLNEPLTPPEFEDLTISRLASLTSIDEATRSYSRCLGKINQYDLIIP